MKLFFKNIWLFSKTNGAIYVTKFCSRAAGELIEVLMNAAENGKQLVNFICCLPTHLLKIVFILVKSLKHRSGDSLLEI
jgi:hypothetical protein